MADLFELSPELDRWMDDNCVITAKDRMEGEVLHYEVVCKKLIELTSLQQKLSEALRQVKMVAEDDWDRSIAVKIANYALEQVENQKR